VSDILGFKHGGLSKNETDSKIEGEKAVAERELVVDCPKMRGWVWIGDCISKCPHYKGLTGYPTPTLLCAFKEVEP